MKAMALRNRFGGTLERFREDLDDLFGRVMGEVAPAAEAWAPRMDMMEAENEYLIRVDLPGVELKDIDVAVEDGMLVMKGERKEEREEKKEGYHRFERFVGSFYRELPLPAGVDADRITAEAQKGVVSIHLPKKPEVKPKKIEVREAKEEPK